MGSWLSVGMTSGSCRAHLAVAAAGLKQSRVEEGQGRPTARTTWWRRLSEFAPVTKRRGGGAQWDRQGIPLTRMIRMTSDNDENDAGDEVI